MRFVGAGIVDEVVAVVFGLDLILRLRRFLLLSAMSWLGLCRSSVELTDLDAKIVSAAWALVISNNVASRLPDVIESQFIVRSNIFNLEITK